VSTDAASVLRLVVGRLAPAARPRRSITETRCHRAARRWRGATTGVAEVARTLALLIAATPLGQPALLMVTALLASTMSRPPALPQFARLPDLEFGPAKDLQLILESTRALPRPANLVALTLRAHHGRPRPWRGFGLKPAQSPAARQACAGPPVSAATTELEPPAPLAFARLLAVASAAWVPALRCLRVETAFSRFGPPGRSSSADPDQRVRTPSPLSAPITARSCRPAGQHPKPR